MPVKVLLVLQEWFMPRDRFYMKVFAGSAGRILLVQEWFLPGLIWSASSISAGAVGNAARIFSA